MDCPAGVGLGQELGEIVIEREAQWLEAMDSQAVMDGGSF